MISRASLCERCANFAGERTAFVRDVFSDCGFKRPQSVICGATDQPEDERWHECRNFNSMKGGATWSRT